MRTGAGLSATVMKASPSPSAAGAEAPRPACQSPVPYLFGGLAAMLGLIALALLILACSYLKITEFLDEGDGGGDAQGGDGRRSEAAEKPAAASVEQFVVIMAGDQKPTFLATPISSRASYLGENPDDSTSGENMNGSVGDEKTAEGGVRGRGGDATQDQNDGNQSHHNHQNL